jgi:carbonic anhydrase
MEEDSVMAAVTRREFGSWIGLAAATSCLAGGSRAWAGAAGPPMPSAAMAGKKAQGPEELWLDLVQGNERFMGGKSQPRPVVQMRRELASGQQPRVIVLGCADSRVSPELVFDKGLGDLFVVRTAGNVADPVALGSIEYAVEHLHARLLVVLGHEKCGAVAAAASGITMPTPGLAAIVSKISPAIDALRAGGAAGDELVYLGVQANVLTSARDLVESSPIVRSHLESRKLAIVKAVYRLATGEVVRLG